MGLGRCLNDPKQRACPRSCCEVSTLTIESISKPCLAKWTRWALLCAKTGPVIVTLCIFCEAASASFFFFPFCDLLVLLFAAFFARVILGVGGRGWGNQKE